MPIRTNRGRTAVYRRLWGWPLRSPRHLIGTLVVLAVLVTTVGIVLPKAVGRPPTGLSAPRPTTSTSFAPRPGLGTATAPATPPTSSLPTRLSTTPTPMSAVPNQDAIRVAKQWAAAWVNHPAGVTNAQWLEGMRPYTTEEYLTAVLSTVDPANVPATKVTGEPSIGTSYTASMQLVIPTDGPKVSITVVSTNEGWRVADYDQAS
ncbi:hypothetical protein [Amycolatopsis sp. H20-H5]|uniref:hypothetical protein n=1 Tax=Amycolatopsis sp. H20-H5 TaxID=3046309 RepID=UPI002DBAD793|nr:hypothetical protein [Amycolatopsis sp. H20-H5]MEC3981927.1 hypothetical protein [Amycolatopsis sp. H20-H5]